MILTHPGKLCFLAGGRTSSQPFPRGIIEVSALGQQGTITLSAQWQQGLRYQSNGGGGTFCQPCSCPEVAGPKSCLIAWPQISKHAGKPKRKMGQVTSRETICEQSQKISFEGFPGKQEDLKLLPTLALRQV